MRDARRFRVLLPLVASIAPLRGFAMKENAAHGERVGREQFLALSRASIACTVAEDILLETEQVKPFDPLPCPVTIAWSGEDRVLPPKVNGALARERIPGARFIVLEDVGHVPMLDDPGLVARTILETTGAGEQSSAPR